MKKILILPIAVVAVLLITAADSKTDALQEQIKKLNLENADLERRLLEASTPPIEVGRRKALLGDGYVIQVSNQTTKMLPVKVHLENPTFGKQADFDLILPAAKLVTGIKEIGSVQGWTAVTGDIITITGQGFTTIKKQLAE